MAVRLGRRAALASALLAVVLGPCASAQTPCRLIDPDLVGAYKGGCKDGLADGYGEAKGAARYEGGFRAGRKHGAGIYVGPAGDTYKGRWANDEPIDVPTPQMMARARMQKERQVALARPGIKACRKVTIGIAEHEWIRGVVVETTETTITVRVEDPGPHASTLDGVQVERGAIVRDFPTRWEPCL